NAQLAASQNQLLAARESLAHAERVAALGQAAANVAHQVGTPLNLISGYVQMILEDPRTDERTRARLQTVDTQIREVTRVLRTIWIVRDARRGWNSSRSARSWNASAKSRSRGSRAPASGCRPRCRRRCRRFAPTSPSSRWHFSISSPMHST